MPDLPLLPAAGLKGPPVIPAALTTGPISYSLNHSVVEITFAAGSNTISIASLTFTATPRLMVAGLRRGPGGPPVIAQTLYGGVATAAYTLSSTVQNITFAAGAHTATKALAASSTAKNITFGAGANTTSAGLHLSSAVKNITFLAGANSTSVAKFLASATKNITFGAGTNTTSTARVVVHILQNITFGAGDNTATGMPTRVSMSVIASKHGTRFHHYGK